MKTGLGLILAVLLAGSMVQAQETAPSGLKLPAIIGDHMVLQADQPDAIWGWAPAGTAVKIDLNDASGKSLAQAEATADANGKWTAKLPTLTAGTAGQLVVVAGAETKIVQDVIVGEDWLCSGQSNMEYNVAALAMGPNSKERAKEAKLPEDMKPAADPGGPQKLATAKKEAADAQGAIRFFMTLRNGNSKPQDDVWGRWEVATPANVGRCSAVAWNFAVQLHDKLGHPVGLIVSAVGGSAAEAWMSEAALNPLSVYPAIQVRVAADAAKFPPGALDKADEAMTAWFEANTVAQIEDKAKDRPMGEPLPTSPKEPKLDVLHTPSRYYNGMIHGLVPFGIKGFLWYQADANSKNPNEYPELIKALITSWRSEWGAELPFYYVETQNMMAYQKEPVDDAPTKPHVYTATMRAMCAAALELPKTGVETAIDLNNTDQSQFNPHFANKKPLGIRLGNLALEEVYGQNLGEVHSPSYVSSTIEGNKIRIKLDHADGLKAIHDGPLTGFAIKGASGPWVWGDATIDGTDLVVSSAQVSDPAAVRYAWAQNPIKNLSVENGVGLPLRPFRTDTGKLP